MSKIKEIVLVKREQDVISYEPVSIDEYNAYEGEKALSHSFVMDCFRKIMGRTLTIIDASVHEKQQNKAMKDLVRNIFSDEMEFVADMAYDQEIICKMANETADEIGIENMQSVSIEEALGVE